MNNFMKMMMRHVPNPVIQDSDIVQLVQGSADARRALVKRAIAAGDLIRVRRGVYVLAPEWRKREVHPFVLAQHMYGPSYVSLETALQYHGWIPEAVYSVRCVSLKQTRRFSTPLGDFEFIRVPQSTLYAEVARHELDQQSFLMASPLKALADYVYVHGHAWTHFAEACEHLRIEPGVLESVEPHTCQDLTDNYRSVRVKKFLRGLNKEMC